MLKTSGPTFLLLLFGSSVVLGSSGCSGDDFTGGSGVPSTGGSGAGGTSGATGAGGSAASSNGGTSGAAGAHLAGAGGSVAGSAGAAGVAQGGQGSAGCAAGQFQCNGDVLQACDSSSGAFVDLQACPAGLCDKDQGRCDTCHVGATVGCKDSMTKNVCGSDGVSTTAMACSASAPFCIGGGQCVECTMVSQCGAMTETCFDPQCSSNTCSAVPSKEGTVVPPADGKATHDCTKTICNGTGGTMKVADPTNTPVDDGTGCTTPVCEGDVPGYMPMKAGTTCQATEVCDGSGHCGVCVPGATKCVENGVAICAEGGTWSAPTGPCAAPTPVCSGGTCVGVAALAISGIHSCALLGDGTVRCWGNNPSWEIGDPSVVGIDVTQPTEIAGLPKVQAIATGAAHMCALDPDGHAWCWGRNDEGELGDGTHGVPFTFPGVTHSTTPVQVKTSETFTQICGGFGHTCGLTSSQQILCWGADGPATGLPSTFDVDQASLPQIANSLPIANARAIVCGENHTCALGSDGIFCWGYNDSGQLGVNTTALEVADPPVQIVGPVMLDGMSYDIDFSMTTTFAAGASHTCSLTPPIGYVCWGADTETQLGDGQLTNSASVVYAHAFDSSAALNGPDFMEARLIAGDQHTCGLLPGMDVRCFGYDADGQLGDGTNPPPEFIKSNVIPTNLMTGTTVLAAGGYNTCAVHDGDLYCWGDNSSGQVGSGMLGGIVPAPSKVVW